MTQGVKDMNNEQPASSIVTRMMETTHGLTYSVARVIEVSAWQSVNAVCLCCVAHSSCIEVKGLQSLLTGAMWATGSACQKQWLECYHLPTLSPHDLLCVHDQPVSSML